MVLKSMHDILLTRRDPVLAETVQAMVPGARVQFIDRRLPDHVGERVWCFVDWLLEDRSGLEVCRHLRAAPHTRHAHITMVLDSNELSARSRALEAGADDYVSGPLTAAVLEERLGYYAGASLEAGGAGPSPAISVNVQAYHAVWNGRMIPLRPVEMRLLQMFILQPNCVLSRESIIDFLGRQEEITDNRTVDVWVGRLRRTLSRHGAHDLIRTVRGLGYVLDAPAKGLPELP